MRVRIVRLAAIAAVSIAFAATAARADSPPASGRSPAPAWLLQYTAVAGGGRIRVTRYVSAHADGTLTWQQLDVDTGIADNGPMHRCTGGAQLSGEELGAIEDAARALQEPRRETSAAPTTSGRHFVSIALIMPHPDGNTKISSLGFDPDASGAEPRLKRAATILSRYRCAR
jgi:hypothetical protein